MRVARMVVAQAIWRSLPDKDGRSRCAIAALAQAAASACSDRLSSRKQVLHLVVRSQRALRSCCDAKLER